jgi:photosystem II stability/assembly factor-like uncharacterized protein
MSMTSLPGLRLSLLAGLIGLLVCSATATDWQSIGPNGGDARSLAYDPRNPDRIFMGTMAGKLFLSSDGGAHWSQFARLGGDDYVLDNVAINPVDPNVMYVAAWALVNNDGDLFRSSDGGKTWQTLPGIHGKSLRAMALAPSDPKIIVVGALDGVYESQDGGDSWAQISPPHHAEIKNVQSVAIDPKNPAIIYAGTWHLPWKTSDGGKTWESIKKGIIDDSDVFSIIIDPTNPSNMYASACSGIYRSESAGLLFHKIQGMPFSARRTRMIRMDPANSDIVYAGTTEGLWKTVNGGKEFVRMTPPNVVVNAILVDPRNPQRVLLATDRGGVLLSENGGQSFTSSNAGFSQRQVASLIVDRNDSNTLYAGLINDKEFGGVFVSHDAGAHWQQMSSGLEERDVFALRQTEGGTLVAGTNRGIFAWGSEEYRWLPINTILTEKKEPVHTASHLKRAAFRTIVARSEFESRVTDVDVSGPVWYAATPKGLFSSTDEGKVWHGGPVAGQSDFLAVQVRKQTIAAASHSGVAISLDSGATWFAANLPAYITDIFGLTLGPENTIWLASRQGVFRSGDNGDSWEHVLSGLPAMNVTSIAYDQETRRLFATALTSSAIYISNDAGYHWARNDAHMPLRGAVSQHGRLFVTTSYDGILAEGEEGQHGTITSSIAAPASTARQ